MSEKMMAEEFLRDMAYRVDDETGMENPKCEGCKAWAVCEGIAYICIDVTLAARACGVEVK